MTMRGAPLWEADRIEDLILFFESRNDKAKSASGLKQKYSIGVRAIERMIAYSLEIGEAVETLGRRLSALLDAIPEDSEPSRWMKSMLIFDLPDRVEGLPVTQGLRILLEKPISWLEDYQSCHPEKEWSRALAFSYIKLCDVYRRQGDSGKAIELYQKSLEIRERIYNRLSIVTIPLC